MCLMKNVLNILFSAEEASYIKRILTKSIQVYATILYSGTSTAMEDHYDTVSEFG